MNPCHTIPCNLLYIYCFVQIHLLLFKKSEQGRNGISIFHTNGMSLVHDL
jgi:hypothetical protein